jgi:hypothetical protein
MPRRAAVIWRLLFCVAVPALLLGGTAWVFLGQGERPRAQASAPPEDVAEASLEDVQDFCGKCHAYPPPDCFPRSAWRQELRQAYDFVRNSPLSGKQPSLESVARFYEKRAPLEFTIPLPSRSDVPPPVTFSPTPVTCPLPSKRPDPGVTFVDLVRLTDKSKFDLLVCDAWNGRVMRCDPDRPEGTWKLLAKLPSPARATVVDLDGDGILDLVVADLGYLLPTNEKFGQVV